MQCSKCTVVLMSVCWFVGAPMATAMTHHCHLRGTEGTAALPRVCDTRRTILDLQSINKKGQISLDGSTASTV